MWRLLIPHGSTVEIGVCNTVTISNPRLPSVKLTRRRPGLRFVLQPVCTEGQWLELRHGR